MVQYAIPKRVGLDDIKDILKAYYVEGAHNEPVSTPAVEDTAQLPDRVGRQTEFLEEVGLLKKDGQKRKLTDAGEEIAEALMGGGEEQAKVRMRELFTDWEFTSKIQGFVQMQGPVEENQLIEYIKANAKSDDDRGKNTLINALLWADILNESDDGLYSVAQPTSPKGEETEPQEPSEESETASKKDEKADGSHFRDERHGATRESGIDIEFNFTTDDDPVEIKKVIKAARKALAADLDNNDDTSTD